MSKYPTKEYNRRYYLKHKDKITLANKKWREENIEKYREYRNEYKKKRRRNGLCTDNEMAAYRQSNARYKKRIKELGLEKPLNERQRQLRRDANKRYRAKKKEERMKLPPKEKKIFVRIKKYIHPDEIERRKQRAKKRTKDWCEKNRLRINAKRMERMAADPSFRIAANFRSMLSTFVKEGVAKKYSSILTLLGCGVDDFIAYLESLFLSGMTWGNYGKNGWEIDHVIPCAHFDLTDFEQQKKCFHFTNLQPMWAFDNRSKGKKLIPQTQNNFIRILP